MTLTCDQAGSAVVSGAKTQKVDLRIQSGEPLRRAIFIDSDDGTPISLVGAEVESVAKFGRTGQCVINIGDYCMIVPGQSEGEPDRIVVDIPVEVIPEGPLEGSWFFFVTLAGEPHRVMAGDCRIAGRFDL